MKIATPPIKRDGGEAVKAVGYLRVSTNGQEQNGHGLPIQREQVLTYCKNQANITLIQFYSDPGISGSEIKNRPGLMKLLEDARKGQFQKVIVFRIDRIARDTFYTLWIEKELKSHGVELVSVTEPYRWEDPSQRIFLQLISAFSEYEKSRIVERMYLGRQRKNKMGGYGGGGLAFGYFIKDGRLEINEKEAIVIRKAKQLRFARKSFRRIAEILTREGFRTRKGGCFHDSHIRYWFKNPVYKGIAQYGEKTKGIHEPIKYPTLK